MLAPLDVGCLTHTVMGSIANGCWVQLLLFGGGGVGGGCPNEAGGGEGAGRFGYIQYMKLRFMLPCTSL